MPLSKMAAEPGRGMRLVKVEEAERQQIRQQATELHQFREQRLQQERQGARERAAGGGNRPRPMNLPHSPVAAHPAHAGAAHADVAHRAGEAHPGGAQQGAARRSDMLQHSSREPAAGRPAHSGQAQLKDDGRLRGQAQPVIKRGREQVVLPAARLHEPPRRPSATESALVRVRKKGHVNQRFREAGSTLRRPRQHQRRVAVDHVLHTLKENARGIPVLVWHDRAQVLGFIVIVDGAGPAIT